MSRIGSSSDIELSILTSHARSIQPPHERVPFSSPISETNFEASSSAMIDEEGPSTPAYFPPSNGISPTLPSSDAGLLEYTRVHGRSEIPLSPRQRENDGTSVHESDSSHDADIAEALPVYRADIPPGYSHSQHDSGDPMTWPAISFRIGFLFPVFWFIGALTLITPQGSLERIFMPWFKDFAPSALLYLNTLETEAEKEAYLARMRVAEIKWAKRCLLAFFLLLCFAAVIAGTIIGVSRIH